MKNQILNLIREQSALSVWEILANIVVAAVIGFVIFVSYAISHRGTIYSKKFNVSLVVLTTLTAMVMTVIGNNVALSLGMVGALSIVRFRTAVKDSRDTVYIFWTIIVGICCGVGDYLVALIGSGVVFFVLLLLGAIKNNNRMLLIIRGAGKRETQIQSIVYSYFKDGAVLRVKNLEKVKGDGAAADLIEMIYEISAKQLKAAEREKGRSICAELNEIEDVSYASAVMQNDEVSG